MDNKTESLYRVFRGLWKYSPNPKFSCNFRLDLSFAFHFLSFPLLIFCDVTVFHLFTLVRTSLNCQISQTKNYFLAKSERISRSVSSLLPVEDLLVMIPNIILISIGSTLLVLVCFDLLYIFIELEVGLCTNPIRVFILTRARNT